MQTLWNLVYLDRSKGGDEDLSVGHKKQPELLLLLLSFVKIVIKYAFSYVQGKDLLLDAIYHITRKTTHSRPPDEFQFFYFFTTISKVSFFRRRRGECSFFFFF